MRAVHLVIDVDGDPKVSDNFYEIKNISAEEIAEFAKNYNTTKDKVLIVTVEGAVEERIESTAKAANES